jgi:nucleotide-binding universal stress UspA family protein
VHVLVATDGVLDPEEVATFAVPLVADDGRVTVLVAVEIPRTLLEDMRKAMGRQSGDETFGLRSEIGGTPTAPIEPATNWLGDDAVIERYLADRLERGSSPIVKLLTDRGITVEAVVVESERPGDAILEQIEALDADLLVIGSYGQDPIHGVIGSIGTKLVRQSPVPVLLIRRSALKAANK